MDRERDAGASLRPGFDLHLRQRVAIIQRVCRIKTDILAFESGSATVPNRQRFFTRCPHGMLDCCALTYRSIIRVSMSTDSDYRVVLTHPSRLDPSMTHALDALAADALEPNVFYESWMLGAALEHLEVPPLSLVLVHHRSDGLTGAFPLELARYRGSSIRSLRSWRHEYLFLCTPPISRRHAAGTLGALLRWSASRQSPAPILELDAVRADGPFYQALRSALADRPSFATDASTFERALLDLRTDVETGLSHKHAKDLRRQERRLADLGTLEYGALAADAAADDWIERFLALETRGWKGEEGTALASDARSRAYFTDIAKQAHRQGRLQMLELTLDGVPVATKCNFVSGEGSFAFKIAHDEHYAKQSPGVLLELFNMQYVAQTRPEVAWMDSCAKAQHFMINRLWTGHRTIGNYAICGRNPIARALVRHRPRIARARAMMRALLGRHRA
jgi:hypothetical protein